MASIKKRPDGKYRVRWIDPDTRKERAEHYSSAERAKQRRAEIEHDLDTGSWIDPRKGNILFADWAEQWWATTVNLRPSSRARDESVLHCHVLPAFGIWPLSSISHMAVRRWVSDLTAKGLAPASVVKAHQTLAKVMAAAVAARKLSASPCERVPLPRIERQEQRFASPDEVARLADAIDARYRVLVLVGAFGGLRIGELAALKRNRVEPLRRRVTVAETLVEVQGRLHFGPPKTRAGRRAVTLPTAVIDELVLHMTHYSGEELVFTSPEGGPLRVNAWRRRYWQPATRRAGLEGLRIHDLRHTAVSWWIAAGANPRQVAVRAGHTSVSTVLDRYGHLMPDADEELADRLGALAVPSAPLAEVVNLGTV